jgi:hypothetical protein
MKKAIVSGFAVVAVAAAVITPLADCAQGQETRAERSASTISQSADRADARIAILKADLRLSADQDQHWGGLESALRDIAAKRSKSLAASHDLQTGRTTTNAPVAPDTSITEDEERRDTDSERDRTGRGWMISMRCGARPTPTPCRPWTCARSPTQRSRSTTHLMTANATGSCNSFAKI